MDRKTRMGPRRAAALHAWALAQEALLNADAISRYESSAIEEWAWMRYEKAAAEEECNVSG